MRNVSEIVRHTKERVSPKGLAVSTAISGAANFAMLPMETGLATTLHELSSGEPSVARIGAVALSVGLNTLSVRKQAEALKEEGYSSSIGGTVLNAGIRKPLVSSTVDHVANWGLLTIFNPINAAAIYNGDPQLLADSMIATSLTIPIWNISLNQAIIDGRADAVVEKIKSLTEPPVLKPVTNLDYHRYQRNIRNR